MPNWCDNHLVLTGPSEVIDEIVAAKLSLMKLVPPPDNQWDYDWACENWGTKWDIGPIEGLTAVDDDHGKKRLDVRFSSAWSPPVEAMQTICNRYPDLSLRLEYIESGMMFVGVMEGTGQEVADSFYTYGNAEDLKAIAKELHHDLAFDEVESMIEWAKEQSDA